MLNMTKNEYSVTIHDDIFDQNVLEFSENRQKFENLSLPKKFKMDTYCENLQSVDQAVRNSNVFDKNEALKSGEQIDIFDQNVFEFSENRQKVENLSLPEKFKMDTD